MQNKIDKKYYVWIWLGLIFATFVRNVYPIYLDIESMIAQASRLGTLSGVFSIVFSYGLVPAAITFLLALILYYISARRHANYVSRNDFCYWTMIFTAVPRLFVGIIESFAILDANVYVVTSTILDVLLLPASYLVMFLWIFAKGYKLNPVEKRNSFAILAAIYMVFYGLGVLGENLAIVSIGADKQLASELSELLSQWGYVVGAITTPIQTVSSAIAICVFFAYLVAVIVLSVLFRKQADEFRDTDTREQYFAKHPSGNGYDRRDDVADTFDEFERRFVHKKDGSNDDSDNDSDHTSGSGNVFDEFDI